MDNFFESRTGIGITALTILSIFSYLIVHNQ